MVAHPAGWHKVYFYPRPLRGGRPVSRRLPLRHKGISIHALCEEGDRGHQRGIQADFDFYPRPLRGGRRGHDRQEQAADGISIHALCEEGDSNRRASSRRRCDFYPRPLRGGRQDDESLRKRVQEFLSTPSARRATSCRCSRLVNERFLSTPSARRATSITAASTRSLSISIHALCEEGDPEDSGRPFPCE